MRIQAVLLLGMLAALGGCAAISDLDPNPAAVAPPSFSGCQAESYAFAGRGTLAGLGLVGQTGGSLLEPNRPAMIWVTRDPVPVDAAAPAATHAIEPNDAAAQGGSRMLCFEFDDGSGVVGMSVDAEWQPPGFDPSAAVNLALPLLLLVVVMVLVVGGLAFRRR